MTFTRSSQRLAAFGVFLVAVAAVVLVLVLPGGSPHLPGGPHHRHHPRPSPSPGPTAHGTTPFAPNSIWNAPLAAGTPLASDSATLVSDLVQQVRQYGSWINSYAFSIPIYAVGAGQPKVPVTLDPQATSDDIDHELARTLAAGVPIPAGATAAPGTDRALVIWQPSTDTLWELWVAERVDGAWHCKWGGKMADVSRNPGYFTNPPDWGTSASSIALLGGTATIAELEAGHVDHALSISIPHARANVWVSPAQRTDGNLHSSTAIPEGTRFRLDPHLDVAKLHLSPIAAEFAYAAQRYGLFVRDQGGSVAFYAQRANSAPSPYAGPQGIFQGKSPSTLLQGFPWGRLQAVSAPLHSYS